MVDFRVDEDFAFELDEEDPLSGFRERFFVRDDRIYLDGNSLGLLCRDAEEWVGRVLDEWKELGIGGWLDGEPPWFYLGEELGGLCAGFVGADEDEVVMTGTTTVNIHQLVSSFYDPVEGCSKILADDLNFPSDIYALRSQIALKGFDPDEDLVLASGEGGVLDEEKIVELMSDDVALVFLPSVLYRSGQLLDMEYLTEEAHKRDILIGFDCAHSVGVVPHEFDEWGVDFATWCGYKYLNGGPGCSAFIYINKKHFNKDPGLYGWFGYVKEDQFDMRLDFESANSAGGWQISAPSILGSAALGGSLGVIDEVGIGAVREKSLRLTGYLMFLVDEVLGGEPYCFGVGNPREDCRRGGHVAVERDEEAFRINEALKSKGVVTDFRPPNVIRVAPVPLYNTYHEVWEVVQYLKEIIDNEEYEEFSKERAEIS